MNNVNIFIVFITILSLRIIGENIAEKYNIDQFSVGFWCGMLSLTLSTLATTWTY